MKRKTILRIVYGLVAAFVLLVVLGWIAFIPSAKEPGYAFVHMWGTKGAAPGRFRDPTGIAVTDDEVFVADARNGRIQVFDHNGRFKRQFGRQGVGELGRPMNLTVSGRELFVADYWNDRIAVFELDGTPKRNIGRAGDGPGEFNAPGGVAVSPSGYLFVADFHNQRIQQFLPDGSFMRQLGKTGAIGIWSGEFNYPTDVAIAPNGTLYVADGYNDRVQAFFPDGQFSHKWGGPFGLNIFGPFNGWFAVVTSVAVDNDGNVFAADFYNHRIQKFAPDGSFLASFGAEGSGPGQFNYPIAMAIAPDGNVFVADHGNNRIQKWRPKRKE